MKRGVWQFAKWCGSSAIGFSTNIGTAVLLHEGFDVRTTWAVAIAYVVTWCVNFLLARHVVFGGKDRRWYRQAAHFAGTTVAFRLLEYGLFLILHKGFELPYFVAQFVVSALAFLGYFAFYRRFVFGGQGGAEDESVR
ncbi:MAG: GtrA family protein [Planctomycetota bacterium]